MAGRKFRLGRSRKNAERKKPETKRKKPGRPQNKSQTNKRTLEHTELVNTFLISVNTVSLEPPLLDSHSHFITKNHFRIISTKKYVLRMMQYLNLLTIKAE